MSICAIRSSGVDQPLSKLAIIVIVAEECARSNIPSCVLETPAQYVMIYLHGSA